MNFSKLPKEKKTHLVMVGLVTVGLLAGLGFGLIKYQYTALKKLDDAKAAANSHLFTMDNSIKKKNQVEADVAEAQRALGALEGAMAPADAYSWIINNVRTFKQNFPKVDMPQWGQATVAEDVDLLPRFPYKQVKMPISSKAHYHDLGVFLAEYENQFPHIRLCNLDLKLNPEAASTAEKEKIAFTVDVVVLVKPTP